MGEKSYHTILLWV